MDKWNNAVGREIGEEIKKEISSYKDKITPEALEDMIADKIMQRMKNGDLITDPKDPRDFESSSHNGRIYTREDIGKMSSEEFRRNEKAIDKQMKNKGVPTDVEAKEAVSSGGMVWVEGYGAREDGTQVKGYYRSKGR